MGDTGPVPAREAVRDYVGVEVVPAGDRQRWVAPRPPGRDLLVVYDWWA